MIETDRLIFRKMTQEDFEEVAKMFRDPEVMYAWEHTFSDKEIVAWIEKRMAQYELVGYDYMLAIDKETGDVVGQIGLLDERIQGEQVVGIGYMLNKAYWGMGYAVEGAKGCLDYALNVLGVQRVVCDIRPENITSIKVAKAIGMVEVGSFVKYYNGKEMVHLIFEKRTGGE